MDSAHMGAELQVSAGPASVVDTEILAVPVFEDDPPGDVADFSEATGGELARAMAAGEFTGKLHDVFLTPVAAGAWRAARLLFVGAGRRVALNGERLRLLAATASSTARRRRVGHLAFATRERLDAVEAVQAVAEGLTLGEFDPGTYKAVERPPVVAHLQVVDARGGTSALHEIGRRGRLLGDASNLARALGNEPSNVLTPTVFAERISGLAAGPNLRVEVLDERDIARLGMGLLLGVARGSAEPPRLVVLRYEPPGAPDTPALGLVGKGITFDSGGISLKPADGMERMKDDMSGGAAVACAMRAIARLDGPTRVVGVIPCTENMPGGRATKPGDVLRSGSGRTVEVINTDAEGRLILADALWHVQRQGATHLVDVATLTGACIVALGKVASGLFGAPDWWVDHVRTVANRAGDRVWPMPLFEEYAEQLRSEIADVLNSGGRPAGAGTAAAFLKDFVEDVPWAHLDIAGTAWQEETKPFQPKGATGVAVRTLAELAFTADRWRQPQAGPQTM